MSSSLLDQQQLIRMHPHPYLFNYKLTRKHLLPCSNQPSLAPPFHPYLIFISLLLTSWTLSFAIIETIYLPFDILYIYPSIISSKNAHALSTLWLFISLFKPSHLYKKCFMLFSFTPIRISCL